RASGGGALVRFCWRCPNSLRCNMLTFDHIALSVPLISEAVDFYRHEFSDAIILYQDETWASIQIGSLKIAFVLEEQHPPHMAFRTNDRDELARLAAEANGRIDVHRDGSESFYQNDPGGNAIEVIYYP